MFGTLPYASTPLATSRRSVLVTTTIADAMAVLNPNTMTATTVTTEIFATTTSSATQTIATLLERIATTGTSTARSTVRTAAAENLRFTELLTVVWKVLISENLTLTGAIIEKIRRLSAIVDTLAATDIASSKLNAKIVVATVIALTEMIATGWAAKAVESIAFQEALAAKLKIIGQLVDSAGFTDTATPQMRILAIYADNMATTNTVAPKLRTLAALSEGVLFYTTLRLGASEYAGWVLNEGVPSQYTNYPFNGFVHFNNRYYGTADDGLYLLEGTQDQTTNINTTVTTALMDFGTGVLKRMPDIYIAFAGGDQMVCKVITSDPRSGAKIESIYTSSVTPGAALHNAHIKPGQGLVSRYWQFSLQNVAGAPFSLDELTFRPLVLDRRT